MTPNEGALLIANCFGALITKAIQFNVRKGLFAGMPE